MKTLFLETAKRKRKCVKETRLKICYYFPVVNLWITGMSWWELCKWWCSSSFSSRTVSAIFFIRVWGRKGVQKRHMHKWILHTQLNGWSTFSRHFLPQNQKEKRNIFQKENEDCFSTFCTVIIFLIYKICFFVKFIISIIHFVDCKKTKLTFSILCAGSVCWPLGTESVS